MYGKQIFLAAALGATFAATETGAAAPVTMRTILNFSQSAWLTPAAVVLRSPQDWTLWNESMVAAQRAVAAEPLSDGVDWSREVLLVVAIGERSTLTTFKLDPPRRSGHRLYFTGRIEVTSTQSFSSPCHVVAIDRRFADAIELDPAIGAFDRPWALLGRRTILANADRSWGAIKHRYR